MTVPAAGVSIEEGFAKVLDQADPLAGFREEFVLPLGEDGSPLVYFLGNSLGPMPKVSKALVDEELDNWATMGIDAHFRARVPWAEYQETIRGSMARVVGAEPLEVVAMNTLTVNIHFMLASFYQPTATRYKILMEDRAFPSDRYAVASHLRLRGADPSAAIVVAKPRTGESAIRTDDLLDLIREEGEHLALVFLGGVNYNTGQFFDLGAIADAGRKAGAVVGYDLAHAAGNVPLSLHDWGVDFAVWCTYKYMNAGPGSIARAFVHSRHGNDPTVPRLAGWWGNEAETRFVMGPSFVPETGAEGWQVSNPPILSLAPLRTALEQFDRAGMTALRSKSESLTGYLAALLAAIPSSPLQQLTPDDPAARGCQLSLHYPGRGRWLHDRLRAEGIVGDYREPDIFRVAPAPLFNTHHEVWRAADAIRRAVAEEGA
ncbi:MAG: kynureninase [Gemmatimonadales bacterium]|nr:MAG: kynureninase [Gemmatimonadales bacterium]